MRARRFWLANRRLGTSRIARVALVAALGFAATSATALASESDTGAAPTSVPGGLAAAPARIELGLRPGAPDLIQDIAVTNRGPRTTHVHAELTDLVITRSGAYETAPSGQTPYSASQIAHIDVDDLNLDATGTPGATGMVRVVATADHLDRPLYGGLSLELADSDAPIVDFGGVRVSPQVRPSILIPVMLVPLDEPTASTTTDGPIGSSQLAQSIKLEVQGVSLAVGQRDQNGWLDHAIPFSLPGIADHGPLAATAGLQNAGNAFGRGFTKYDFTGVSPFGWLPTSWRGVFGLDERPFLEVDAAPAPLMPDMVGETRVATTYPTGRGGELDSTPWFGLVRVHATTSLVLADFESAPVVQETYVLVLPWKEALVAIGAWTVWRVLRRWWTRRRGTSSLVSVVPQESAKAA